MRAAIDLGSNSCLLLAHTPEGAVERAEVVGLGAGLGDGGALRPDRVDRAIAVLRDYRDALDRLGIAPWETRLVTTSAVRRATNRAAFAARVLSDTGFALHVIEGREEARLTSLGALGWAPLSLPDGPVSIVDIGGGSTEIATLAPDGAPHHAVSLELGTLRLTEAHLGGADASPTRALAGADALQRHVQTTLAAAGLPTPAAVVAVAGTATTLAALSLGLTAWDPARVHGTILRGPDLRATAADFAARTPAERAAACEIEPRRAPWLAAGGWILAEVLDALGAGEAVVSWGDLRAGVLADARLREAGSATN